jgi:hypothetical protein
MFLAVMFLTVKQPPYYPGFNFFDGAPNMALAPRYNPWLRYGG